MRRIRNVLDNEIRFSRNYFHLEETKLSVDIV